MPFHPTPQAASPGPPSPTGRQTPDQCACCCWHPNTETAQPICCSRNRSCSLASTSAAAIHSTGEALLVEGPLMWIQLHQAGFTTAVAAMGSALTIEQLQLLQRRGGRRLLVVCDGDGAGTRATGKLIAGLRSALIGSGLELAVVELPTGSDPDGLAAPAAMYPQPPGSPPRSSAPSWRLAAPRCLPCAGAACSRSVAIWCLRTPPPAVRICFDIGIAAPLCFAPVHLPAEVPSPCLPLRRPTTLCFFIRTLTQPLTPHGPLRRASTESGAWVCFWARRVAWDREHL